jgi:hypothetical protein
LHLVLPDSLFRHSFLSFSCILHLNLGANNGLELIDSE